jgi:hypothetical protein
MAGVGVYGGYQPVVAGVDWPPGPSLWSAGQTWPLRSSKRVYANDLNLQLSQPVAFLSRKPLFKGTQQAANQSVNPVHQTPISLDTEIADPWYIHSQGDATQILVPLGGDGIWLVQGTVPFAASASGNYIYQANLARNGTITANGERLGAPGIHVSSSVADLIPASAGDNLQLVGYHNYSSAVNTYINTSSGGTPYSDNTCPVITARWAAANNSLPAGVLNGVTLGVPSPGTWTTLQEATSSQFNTDIRNSVNFLANVPACRAGAANGGASLASGTAGQVTGLTASIDNWGAFASNTWTCPRSGLYLVMGATSFPAAGSAYVSYTQIKAVQSSVTTYYTGAMTYSYWPGSMVLKALRFTAGDTVKLYGYQASGSSHAPDLFGNTRLFTLWLSS